MTAKIDGGPPMQSNKLGSQKLKIGVGYQMGLNSDGKDLLDNNDDYHPFKAIKNKDRSLD
jgi:hypothetical protein